MPLLKNLGPATPEAIHYPMNFTLSLPTVYFFLIKPVLFGFLSFAVEIILNNREDLNNLWFKARKTKLIQNHGCRGFLGGSVVKNLPANVGHAAQHLIRGHAACLRASQPRATTVRWRSVAGGCTAESLMTWSPWSMREAPQ